MENQDIKKWILRIVIIWVVLGAAMAMATVMGWLSKQDFMLVFLAGMVLFAAITGGLNNQLLANRQKETTQETTDAED
jgi:hypothetical protein